MAPRTRSTKHPSTPLNNIDPPDYTTTKKTRFFEAYDTRNAEESMQSIAIDKHISKTTASRWLREREEIGSPAY